MLHMLQRTADHFELFTKLVQSYPFAPENSETWLIVEESKDKKKLRKKICSLVQYQQENEKLSHNFSNNKNTK